MRLAVLVTHPVQYFAPVFRELAQNSDLELKVFFGCDHGAKSSEDPGFQTTFKWDSQPAEGFDFHFLSTEPLEHLEGFSGIRLAGKAVATIQGYQPDKILIFAYSPLFITASTIFLRLADFSLMLRAETSNEARTRSWFKNTIRQFLLRVYYRQFEHFFPIGTHSIQHYQSMGVGEGRLTPVYYSIDVDFFQKQIEKWVPQREELRKTAGISSRDHVFLYCGKMYWPKNPLLIAQALALLSKTQKEKIWLVAVGTGDWRDKFENAVHAQLGKRVIFAGFKNQLELGEFYSMADTLILPSQSGETWGLVVNEALQFGLRVIVSDKVGSACDLIKDPKRGSIFPSGDAKALSKEIVQALEYQASSSLEADTLPHPKHFAEAIYSHLTHE